MPRPLTLQRILGLHFIVAATLPMLLFGWFAYRYLADRQLEEAQTDLQGHALSIRDEVEDFFGQVESNLLLIRNSVEQLQGAAPQMVDAHLQAATVQSRYFDAVYLLDKNMRVRSVGLSAEMAAQRNDYVALDFSGLGVIAGHDASDIMSVPESDPEIRKSETFVSVATGRPAVMLLAKIQDDYLLATIDLDRLSDYLRRRQRQSDEMAFAVIDHHGTLIAHTDQRLALERTNYLTHPEILSALASGKGVDRKLHEDLTLLESVQVVRPDGWIIYASMPREVATLAADRLLTLLASGIVAVVMLSGILAFWQARRVARPLLQLRDSTQEIALGEYRHLEQLGGGSYAELNDLSVNFQQMCSAVIERETFLQASEERYRSLIAGMGEGMLIVSCDGRVVDCNQVAEQVFSLPRSEILGGILFNGHWRVIREDGTTLPREGYPTNVVLQTGSAVDNQLIGLCGPDGRETWLQVNCRPQWSLHGGVSAAVLTFSDVTRLKAAEASLRLGGLRYRELFQQFTALLEGITDRIDLMSPDMRVIWSNHLEAGLEPGNEAQRDRRCCFTVRFGRSEPCEGCPAVRCFATGQREIGEIADDHGRIWNLRAFPVRGEGVVSQVVLIAEDVTDKREGERQRTRASQLAALGELAAGVAHEINNPISGVINYAQLILNRSAPESREHELAKRIIKEGDRIAAIVRELLIFAREEGSDVKLVSVHETLAEALTLCESQLRKEAINLHIDLPSALPRVECRSHQIPQLFLNLLSNARHALADKYPEGSPDKLLRISGEQVAINGRPFIRVRVRDHGSGIPPELLEKVMNPFITTKPAGVGTGLGLSISFEIVKKHGGTLSIASEYGTWTEVTFELPVATAVG